MTNPYEAPQSEPVKTEKRREPDSQREPDSPLWMVVVGMIFALLLLLVKALIEALGP